MSMFSCIVYNQVQEIYLGESWIVIKKMSIELQFSSKNLSKNSLPKSYKIA